MYTANAGVLFVQANKLYCSGGEESLSDCSIEFTVNPVCGLDALAGVKCYEIESTYSCEGAGRTTCCMGAASFCRVSDTCMCDISCHAFNDCCADIHYTCPANGEHCF